MAGRFRFFVRNQPRLLFNNGTNRTKQKSAAQDGTEYRKQADEGMRKENVIS